MTQTALPSSADAIVVGAGHNGLVAAAVLARAGLSVVVLEHKEVIGGAVRTERPFARAPGLATSTGAYLLGLMPPELPRLLEVELPVLRRDPHYFLPRQERGFLLFGSDRAALREQFLSFFSEADWDANERLQAELSALRDDIGPTWLQEPLSIEETAARFVRPALQESFVSLCRGAIGPWLQRFGFQSELLLSMYAVTDGFSGLDGTWDTPGTGMNFLVHNLCRLPGADGTWMIVRGGMGTVTRLLAEAATRANAAIFTGCEVTGLLVERGAVQGVALADGREVRAPRVLMNGDPFRALKLAGEALPADFHGRIGRLRRPGTTMKVNLALRGLPRFTCLPEDRGQFGSTMHLLPDSGDPIGELIRGYQAVKRGELLPFPTIEWYVHTTVDPSLRDAAGHHNSALFVQWVPEQPAGSTWDAEEERYVRQLLSVCDRFAPGTSDLVADTFALTPPKIESHFGITAGHIHHVDNGFGFSDRAPYRTPLPGFFLCGAGCHPAGSVIGAAGHNAAQAVLRG